MYARTKGLNNKDQNYDHFDNSNNNTSIYSAAEQAEWTIQSYKTMYEESKIGGGHNSDRYTTTAPTRPTPNDNNNSIHNIYDIHSSNGSSSYNYSYNNGTNSTNNTNYIRGDEQFKLSRDSSDSNNSTDSIHHSIYNTNANNNKVYNNTYIDTIHNQNTTNDSAVDAYNTTYNNSTYNNTTTTHSNTDFSKDSLDITTTAASATAGAAGGGGRRKPSTSTTMLSTPLSSLPPPPTTHALGSHRIHTTHTTHPAKGIPAVMDFTTAPASSSSSKRNSSVGIAYTSSNTTTTPSTTVPQQSSSSRGSVGGGLIPNKAPNVRKSVFLTQDESEEFSSTIQHAATHRMSVQYYDSKYGSDDRSSADATNNSADRSHSDVGRENTAHILSANDAYNISHNSSSRNSYSSTGDEADDDDGGDDESDVTPPPYAYESHFDEFMMTTIRPDSDAEQGNASNTIASAYAASGLRGASVLESNWTAVLPSQAEAKSQSGNHDNNPPFLQPSASSKAFDISLNDIHLSSTTYTTGYKSTNISSNYTNAESKISSPIAEAKSPTARASSSSPQVPVVLEEEDDGEMELHSDSKADIEVRYSINILAVYALLN